ncbi:MAG: hypothetical protein OXB98_01120 [Bryobacterales bacterium]|nr:hypothetical protein [Bryobacterales bacterium]
MRLERQHGVLRDPVSAARYDSLPIDTGSERLDHAPCLNPAVLSVCRWLEVARNPLGDGHFFVPTAVLRLPPSATTETTA